MSFAIYELLADRAAVSASAEAAREGSGSYRERLDEEVKSVSLKVEEALEGHKSVVDWQSNLEVQREMRRDIKRELRLTGEYTEERLEELAGQIVELARRRSGR